MTIINDPRRGDAAYVNAKHQLKVKAVSESEAFAAAEDGDAYNINTGLIALTNSTVTPILYLENHEDHEIVIEAIVIGIDDLGTHTGTPVIKVIKNATSIDFSAAVDMNQNRKFSSSKTLKTTTLVYKGAVGDTVTGGSDTLLFLMQEGGRMYATIDMIIGVGNSLCITMDAQVTAGTASVYAALVCHVYPDVH